MAWFSLRFLSSALRQETTVNLVLPETSDNKPVSPTKLPIVYLLHGYTNNQNRWLLDTNVHYLAKHYGVIVIMPFGGNSFYTDTVAGGNFQTYLMDELPSYLNAWFGISFKHKDTYIAGNSMGGFGAMKYALTYPSKFKAVGAFSGPLDISFVELANHLAPDEARTVTHDFPDMSEWMPGGSNDPATWIRTYMEMIAKDSKKAVDISLYCGTEDWLLPLSNAFASRARAAGISVDVNTSTGGHNFLYWQEALGKWFERVFSGRAPYV